MAVTRRTYAGAPVQTTITASISNVDTAIAIAVATGWPTGAPFFVTIDYDLAGEEKALVTRSGTALTAATRGADGTVASAHASGAKIRPCIAATDLDEANRLAAIMTTQGDLTVADASGNPSRLARGTNGHPLVAGAATLAYGQLGTVGIADLAVTAAKIAADTITAAQIAPDAIGSSELANNAVDTAAIAALAVTEAKLAATLPARHAIQAFSTVTTTCNGGGTSTAVAFNSETYDTDGYHDAAVNAARFTVPAGLAGYYVITLTLKLDAAMGGGSFVGLTLNGVFVFAAQQVGINAPVSVSAGIVLAVGDFIEAVVRNNDAPSRTVQVVSGSGSEGQSPFIQMVRVTA